MVFIFYIGRPIGAQAGVLWDPTGLSYYCFSGVLKFLRQKKHIPEGDNYMNTSKKFNAIVEADQFVTDGHF